MCSYSGLKTGRSPKDRRIVLDKLTENDICWGHVNIPIEHKAYLFCQSRAIDYMSSRHRIFVTDGYYGWDPKYRLKIRVISVRPYHALFMRNMLIVPTKEELDRDFSGDQIDYHVFNAGEHPNNKLYEGTGTKTAVCINLSEKNMTILGTQYAGEMKKGLFTIINYLMPKIGILPIHASANESKNGDVSVFFGLSGTGKTTLSTDSSRKLIGDDEHCWGDNGIFNLEGGCYAKCNNLTKDKEPELYNAIKFGTVLENVDFTDVHEHEVDWTSTKITENARACYPLRHIEGAKIPAIGGHPKNIFFLTCDAYGVLPPVSRLTYEQAMYHFLSGYTSKVAVTEVGLKDPEKTFSACFGEGFLPLHPIVYAELFGKKIKQHGSKVWLINTGWSGKCGVGKRMNLKTTKTIIDSILKGELENVKTHQSSVFNLTIPDSVHGINSEILSPENTWSNKDEFKNTLIKLAESFKLNFTKYEKKVPETIVQNGGPILH